MSVLPASYLSSPFAENAEVSVVLCPVGPTATACQAAMPLLPQIAKFTRVPLRDARKFYSPDHKSPFPGIPWETGHIKYSFSSLPLESVGALFASDWLCIHTHLRLMAIVAVAHGPSIGPAGARLCSEALAATDDRLHTTFGPQAPLLHRLVVLEPTEVQMANKAELVQAQAATVSGEDEAREFVLRLTAGLVAALESLALSQTPSATSLTTPLDAAARLDPLQALQIKGKDEAGLSKKRMGRVRKTIGDAALLCGAHGDALEHYNNALDLARNSGDSVWAAGALEGVAAAHFLSGNAPDALTAAHACSAAYQRLGFLDRAAAVRSRALRVTSAVPGEVGKEAEEGEGAPANAAPGATGTPLGPSHGRPSSEALSRAWAAAREITDPVLLFSELASLSAAAVEARRPRFSSLVRHHALSVLLDSGPSPLPPCASAGVVCSALGSPIPPGTLAELYVSLADSLTASRFDRPLLLVAAAWGLGFRDTVGLLAPAADLPAPRRPRTDRRDRRPPRPASTAVPPPMWPEALALVLSVVSEQPGQYPPAACAEICHRLVGALQRDHAHLGTHVQQELVDCAVDLSRALAPRSADAAVPGAGEPLPGLAVPCDFLTALCTVERTGSASAKLNRSTSHTRDSAAMGPFLFVPAKLRQVGGKRDDAPRELGTSADEGATVQVSVVSGLDAVLVPWSLQLVSWPGEAEASRAAEGGRDREGSRRRAGTWWTHATGGGVGGRPPPAGMSTRGTYQHPSQGAAVSVLPGAAQAGPAATHAAVVCAGLNLLVPLRPPLVVRPSHAHPPAATPEPSAWHGFLGTPEDRDRAGGGRGAAEVAGTPGTAGRELAVDSEGDEDEASPSACPWRVEVEVWREEAGSLTSADGHARGLLGARAENGVAAGREGPRATEKIPACQRWSIRVRLWRQGAAVGVASAAWDAAGPVVASVGISALGPSNGGAGSLPWVLAGQTQRVLHGGGGGEGQPDAGWGSPNGGEALELLRCKARFLYPGEYAVIARVDVEDKRIEAQARVRVDGVE